MGVKKRHKVLRRAVGQSTEELIISELRKLKAPWWRRVLNYKLREWYKSQEAKIEARFLRAGRNIYRGLK